MRTISKAIAGGLGASISKVVSGIIKHYFPDIDADSVDYIIYTLVTGLIVYIAPANKQ